MEERPQIGKHFSEVHSPLSKADERSVLRGLSTARALDFLERHPLKAIRLVPHLTDAEGDRLLGKYAFNDKRLDYQTIYVNTSRSPNEYGQPFVPGRVRSVSITGADPVAASKRTLVHELGHHVLQVAGSKGRAILIAAALKSGEAMPITKRAAQGLDEYFAECFSAYVFHRKSLREFDPVGYNLVRQLRELVGMKP